MSETKTPNLDGLVQEAQQAYADTNENVNEAEAELASLKRRCEDAEHRLAWMARKARLADDAMPWLEEQLLRLEQHGATDMRFGAWIRAYHELTGEAMAALRRGGE